MQIPLDPLRIIRLMLPTLCICYSLSWSTLTALPQRQELFGSGDLYLNIQLDGIPSRMISGIETPETVAFKGSLASETAESIVSGRRVRVKGQTWYFFDSAEGKFLGWLSKSARGCEPTMHYRLEKNGKVVKRGEMRAGFCS